MITSYAIEVRSYNATTKVYTEGVASGVVRGLPAETSWNSTETLRAYLYYSARVTATNADGQTSAVSEWNDLWQALPPVICGDGRRDGEQCDDGNTESGDGCTATCETESGFKCYGGSRYSSDNCKIVPLEISVELAKELGAATTVVVAAAVGAAVAGSVGGSVGGAMSGSAAPGSPAPVHNLIAKVQFAAVTGGMATDTGDAHKEFAKSLKWMTMTEGGAGFFDALGNTSNASNETDVDGNGTNGTTPSSAARPPARPGRPAGTWRSPS
jgi:cysteine-rich repeat protein